MTLKISLLGGIGTAIAIAVTLYLAVGLKTVRVVETSMEPYIAAGAIVTVDRALYRPRGIRAGDAVVFAVRDAESGRSSLLIKRCFLAENEAIVVKDGRLFNLQSDSVEISRSHVAFFKELTTVPIGKYYMVGDNRDASVDSREFGFVNKESIFGRVVAVRNP